MKQLQFTIHIAAPRTTVWSALWDDAHYREWTSAFTEGSYALSDWKEGGRIQFMAPGGDGMFSKIARVVPGEFISFQHLGVIKDGIEQPSTDKTKMWEGATENYTLEESNDGTLLKVAMEVAEEDEAMFHKSFPDALLLVKKIAERMYQS